MKLPTVSWRAARLPTTAVPDHYEIVLAPDLDEATFRGEETIALRLLEPTARVTLNAAEIEFSAATITAAGRTQAARVSLDATREQATLTVPEPLPAGPATLRISFSGSPSDKLRGFYLSKTATRKYAVTQMETPRKSMKPLT